MKWIGYGINLTSLILWLSPEGFWSFILRESEKAWKSKGVRLKLLYRNQNSPVEMLQKLSLGLGNYFPWVTALENSMEATKSLWFFPLDGFPEPPRYVDFWKPLVFYIEQFLRTTPHLGSCRVPVQFILLWSTIGKTPNFFVNSASGGCLGAENWRFFG